MHIYAVTYTPALFTLRGLAALTAISYARWHYWWRSSLGLSFMAILFVFISRIPQQIVDVANPDASGRLTDTTDWIELAGTILAAIALGYLLYALIAANIRRARTPSPDQARKYLEQTPGASAKEIRELVTYWEILRGLRNSAASVQPDQ